MNCPKILIIGATPWRPDHQTRSYESYFYYFPKEFLRQIFSNSLTPVKGICGELYQITDGGLLKARFSKKDKTGRLFRYENCLDGCPVKGPRISKRIPLKNTGLYRLIRKWIWKKRYWLTEELLNWVVEFKPDLIFLCTGEDFFQYEIASYFSKELHVPIIASITDDVYFKNHFSLSPFWWIYKNLINKRIKSFMKLDVTGSFCSDKIKDKYCGYFGIPGFTQYIASKKASFSLCSPLPISIKKAFYFGNLEYGRWNSLVDIAGAFMKEKNVVEVHVYTSDYVSYKKKKRPSNLILHSPVSYAEVLEMTQKADLLLIVESFKQKYVRDTAYSLSTKVADCLSSGRPILCYAHAQTGAAWFLKNKDAAIIATNKEELELAVRQISNQAVDFEALSNKEMQVFDACFNIEDQAELFKERAEKIVQEFKLKND